MSASAIFHAFHVTLRENGQSSESSHGELPLPLLSVAGEKSPFWADWFGYKFENTPFGWACNIPTQSSVSQLTSLSYTQQGLFRSISTIKTPISSCFIKKKKKTMCLTWHRKYKPSEKKSLYSHCNDPKLPKSRSKSSPFLLLPGKSSPFLVIVYYSVTGSL